MINIYFLVPSAIQVSHGVAALDLQFHWVEALTSYLLSKPTLLSNSDKHIWVFLRSYGVDILKIRE